jgi:hypothetical protein
MPAIDNSIAVDPTAAVRATSDRLRAHSSRYNAPVEPSRARHISEIIKERDNRAAVAGAAETNRRIIRIQEFLRLFLDAMLSVFQIIGWLVSRPFLFLDQKLSRG